MDKSRIAEIVDGVRVGASHVTVVGNGGGANLGRNLVRCGVENIALVDFDTVELVNICRQEHMHDMVGWRKVHALAAELRRINPDVNVECFPEDFCSFTDEAIDLHFGHTDLFIFAVDNLKANARGNVTALRMGKPALWSGVYPKGRAGEVVFWRPGLKACYRCLLSTRYQAHERGIIRPAAPTDSADVFAVQIVDGIAGIIALGILTSGADNAYGRLIEKLGDRNFLQVKIDPDWNWNGRDVIREQLQVPADCPAYFSFCTIARRDPADGEPPCPDCVRYLGRQARLPIGEPAVVV